MRTKNNFSETKCPHNLYVEKYLQLCISGCMCRHIFTFAHDIFLGNAKNNQLKVRRPLHAVMYNGKIFFELPLLYRCKPLVVRALSLMSDAMGLGREEGNFTARTNVCKCLCKFWKSQQENCVWRLVV